MPVRYLNAFALFILLAGCGKSGPDLAPVSGVIKIDGEPMENVDVAFQPQEGKSPSYGRTDKNGHYELGYKQGVVGALVGKHTVRITASHELMRNPPNLPAKFNSSSELTYEVKSGKNDDANFDVTSEGK